MKKDYIRNFKGDIIGSIETDTVTGNKIGRTFLGTIVARYNKEFNITSDFLGNVISRGDAISAALYDAYNKKNPGKLWEAVEVNTIAKQTCGYIKPDGSLIELDEYHGEDETLRDLKYIEYSNTHFEEDTCVRIYKEPTEAQHKRLEEIIDLYLDWEGYCKIEIWLSSSKYRFYKVFSIIEGACPGYEEVFNETWTGEKLCRIIRNQFSRVWDPELHESSDWVKLSEGKFEGKSIKYGDIKLTEADKTTLTNWLKEHFICSKTFTGNSCYLLADGTYLDVGDAHSNIDQLILDFLRDHNYIDDIDNEWATLSEHFIDINLNAIHCGNNHYDYIVVDSRCNPTQAQYKALESYDLYYLDHEEGYDISICDSTDCRRSAVYYDADKHELVDCYGRKTSAAAKISSYYANNKLTFNINEATRNQLITKSRRADFYSDKAKGNRWTAKSQCKIASTVKDYNRIDMDTFWKRDILNFDIKVQGETDTYDVTIEFNHILKNLQSEIKKNKNKLDQQIIYRALMASINNNQIKVDCSCPDFKYREAYAATKGGYKAGSAENRPSDITNPTDSKGAGCKHILAALNNAEWLKKIASVINNYINYCKDNMEYNYAKFIFPNVYGIPYQKAVQMCLDNYDENGDVVDIMKSDQETINLSNALGKIRGRFKSGSNKNPVTSNKR